MAVFYKISNVVSYCIDCNLKTQQAGAGYKLLKITQDSFIPRSSMNQYCTYYGEYATSSTATYNKMICAIRIGRDANDYMLYVYTHIGSGYVKGRIYCTGTYIAIK